MEGRRILDNILLSQEIVKDYNRNKGRPRCTMKVDIKKGFRLSELSFCEDTFGSNEFSYNFLY